MLIEKMADTTLFGLIWENGSFDESASIEIRDLNKYICHFVVHYRYFSKRYIGINDYIFNAFSRFDYLKYDLKSFFDNKKQLTYNKKKFATPERIELLRRIIQLGLRTHRQGFMTMDLMTEMYTLRWVAHPDSIEQEDRLQLFVDSFLESKEIQTTDNIHYFVTGKAINTLSEYEEHERRHNENIKLQNRLIFLTFAIVGVGLLQAFVSYCK